jgi:predicted DNA-binding ribbon-helix-helix protein
MTNILLSDNGENAHFPPKKRPKREKTTLISHNIIIEGRRTSVRLEKEMWMAIKEIARRERCTVHALCDIVSQRKKTDTSLTAAIRVFIMAYFQAAATDDGHLRAGHGTGPNIVTDIMVKNASKPYYGLREFKTLNGF